MPKGKCANTKHIETMKVKSMQRRVHEIPALQKVKKQNTSKQKHKDTKRSKKSYRAGKKENEKAAGTEREVKKYTLQCLTSTDSTMSCSGYTKDTKKKAKVQKSDTKRQLIVRGQHVCETKVPKKSNAFKCMSLPNNVYILYIYISKEFVLKSHVNLLQLRH